MTKQQTFELDGVAYAVEEKLGQGGSAQVFRVCSSADQARYALKQIRKATKDARRNERFRNEISFGLTADNDHVVRIYSQHEDEQHFYYTMRCYPNSLRGVITQESDYAVILDYVAQLCDGLAYVHDRGVVHRDLKPENILVDPGNHELVIADFGIAHFKDSTLTTRDDLLANRNYQAPEQMAKGSATQVGPAADIFAMGLIFTELFTKQNPRGVRQKRVGHVFPFLAELDALIDQMTLQESSLRLDIHAVRDSVELIRRDVAAMMATLAEDLNDADAGTGTELRQAAEDVISAAFIFEHADDTEIARHNLNFHCNISYSVDDELFNASVHTAVYTLCKAKFEYEATGNWDKSDAQSVLAPGKSKLLSKFDSVLSEFKLPPDSEWAALASLARHYFRMCKDYHCDELLRSIGDVTRNIGPGSLRDDLLDSPILWIVRAARQHLASDEFPMTPLNRERVELMYHLRVDWDGTQIHDLRCTADGQNLFEPALGAASIASTLQVLQRNWSVSLAQRQAGWYWVHFRSRDEYDRFCSFALANVEPGSVLEADVEHLIDAEADYDDLVALRWDTTFDIPYTLAKVLQLRN